MSKPGPKTKSAAYRRHYGNPGKRPINENEPKPGLLDELPLAPPFLGKAGLWFYEYYGEILRETGILTRADVPGLIVISGAWEEYVWAMEMLHEDAECRTSVSDKGYSQIAAVITIKNSAIKQMKEWFALYCLTPSSRAGKVAEGKQAMDPLAALRELMQEGVSSKKKTRGTG